MADLHFLDRRCTHPNCEGKAEAYRMVGGCYNCKSALLGLFTAGHEASGLSGDCPVCGVAFRLHWDRLATPDEIPASTATCGKR
jgi:hypothetical protein